jgi:N-acetylmuramate 1-kinase
MYEWATRAVARRWSGAHLKELRPLKGDASMRRFWRGFIDQTTDPAVPPTVVAIDLGPDDLPLYARALNLVPGPLKEPPFVSVHRLMERIGIAVPALYVAASADRKLMVEDVGDLSLYEAVKTDPARTAVLYRLAVDELVKLHLAGTTYPDRDCIAYSIAYDRRLFRWEMERFVQFGIAEVAPGADAATLTPELDRLAELLDAAPRVLSHRDYHYQNLFIQVGNNPRIRVIDFQDALLAPAAQDLAVLMTTRDTGAVISPELEAELLDRYFEATTKRTIGGLDRAAFLQSYRWCVLQHALKVIGLFLFLEQSGKPGYQVYLPAAVRQARRMLAADGDFPILWGVLSRV